MTQEELIQKYKENEDAVKALKASQIDVLKQLKAFYPHKEGEIVKWTEKGRKKRVGGSIWHPVYEQLPDKEHLAVLTDIKPSIWLWQDKPDLTYHMEFNEIRKDGELSKNHCYVDKDNMQWTGEIFKDYKQEED